jgi:dGTPase
LDRLRRAVAGVPSRTPNVEYDKFMEDVIQAAKRADAEKPIPHGIDADEYLNVAEKLFTLMPFSEPYTGTARQRADLRRWISLGITRYSSGIRVRRTTAGDGRVVEIEPVHAVEVDILKRLTWYYVINNPSLYTQQEGYRTVVKQLYEIHFQAASDNTEKGWFMFPVSSREQLEAIQGLQGASRTAGIIRIVADFIAGLTEGQALNLYQRVTGLARGSVFDPIVR